jgi:hypothetical protein
MLLEVTNSMLKKHIISLTFIFIIVLIVATLYNTKTALSAADHLVISEVQRQGVSADDEFVELYNPTNSPVNISDWSLTRINSSNTEGNLVSSFPDSTTVAPFGYFLVAHEDYDGTVLKDQEYTNNSNPIGTGSTVVLKDDLGEVVDKVGFGTELTPPTSPEGSAAENPPIDGSVERKANDASTSESMGPGGDDENDGNGEDTDNNANDFVTREVSDPQNTSSNVEPEIEPTATPTLVPTPTPTGEPTATPTIEPTPSVEPTATPTLEPTPTTEPTATPTLEPTPTSGPEPTASPSPIPEPEVQGRVIGRFPFAGIECKITYKLYRFGFLRFIFPVINCS